MLPLRRFRGVIFSCIVAIWCYAFPVRPVAQGLPSSGSWVVTETNDAVLRRISSSPRITLDKDRFWIAPGLFGHYSIQEATPFRVRVRMNLWHLSIACREADILSLNPRQLLITTADGRTFYRLEKDGA